MEDDAKMEVRKPQERSYVGMLLKPSDVATILQVNPATILRWIKDGKLPAIRLPSGVFKVRGETVDAILREYEPE